MRPITAVMLDVVLVGGDAVMCEQGVENGTEDTSLWSSNVCDEAGCCPISNPNSLESASYEVKESVTENRVETKRGQFVAEFVGDHRVEGRVVVHKEHPNVGLFVF